MPFSNNSYTQGDPKVKHFLEFPKENFQYLYNMETSREEVTNVGF